MLGILIIDVSILLPFGSRCLDRWCEALGVGSMARRSAPAFVIYGM